LISYTQHNLTKLEELFRDLGYTLRFEKGSFRTGACVLQDKKVVVVNRFSVLEAKIRSLVQLLQEMDVDPSVLDEKKRVFYENINKLAV